jgi:hypothetical protein
MNKGKKGPQLLWMSSTNQISGLVFVELLPDVLEEITV